jgi:hypothetical protein
VSSCAGRVAASKPARTSAQALQTDKVLAFVSRMPLLYGEDSPAASSYACPMHPEVTASQPATCPQCGMKLVPSDAPRVPAQVAQSAHDHGDGLEWED